MIGGDALQPADRNRLAVDAAAAARRLARPIARAPEDAGKHVRLTIQDVGVIEPALRDHADVFRHVRVRGTGPLAIDDAMVIVRIRCIRPVHFTGLCRRRRGNRRKRRRPTPPRSGAGSGPEADFAGLDASTRWFRPDSVMKPFRKLSSGERSMIVATP